jgi:hypothetical protein
MTSQMRSVNFEIAMHLLFPSKSTRYKATAKGTYPIRHEAYCVLFTHNVQCLRWLNTTGRKWTLSALPIQHTSFCLLCALGTLYQLFTINIATSPTPFYLSNTTLLKTEICAYLASVFRLQPRSICKTDCRLTRITKLNSFQVPGVPSRIRSCLRMKGHSLSSILLACGFAWFCVCLCTSSLRKVQHLHLYHVFSRASRFCLWLLFGPCVLATSERK